jgi:hypothetical protein
MPTNTIIRSSPPIAIPRHFRAFAFGRTRCKLTRPFESSLSSDSSSLVLLLLDIVYVRLKETTQQQQQRTGFYKY